MRNRRPRPAPARVTRSSSTSDGLFSGRERDVMQAALATDGLRLGRGCYDRNPEPGAFVTVRVGRVFRRVWAAAL